MNKNIIITVVVGATLAGAVLLALSQKDVSPNPSGTDISPPITALHVSPNRADTNPCTAALPCKTITKAVSVASSGDTIYLREGTYGGESVTISKSVTLAAYQNERAVVTSNLRLAGDNIVVEKLHVDGVSSPGGAGIFSYGKNNIIRNNVVANNTESRTSGILIYQTTGNIVTGNEVYNNGYSGIRISGGSGHVVSGNEVYRHTISGGNSDGINCNGGSGNTFSGNTVYANADDGIDTWNCTNSIVTGNVAWGHGNGGDGNGFKLGYGGDNLITDNVAYDNEWRGFSSNGGGGNYYKNNTAYGNGHCGFEDNWRVAGDTRISTFDGNTSYGNKFDYCLGQYSIVLTVATPTRTPTRTITASPTATRTATIVLTPIPDGMRCVLVTWHRALNLRPSASMFNASYSDMYFGNGARFPVQAIFENSEGRWMQINERIFSTMWLKSNNNTYAVETECKWAILHYSRWSEYVAGQRISCKVVRRMNKKTAL